MGGFALATCATKDRDKPHRLVIGILWSEREKSRLLARCNLSHWIYSTDDGMEIFAFFHATCKIAIESLGWFLRHLQSNLWYCRLPLHACSWLELSRTQ
jgi:hypothetical protein